MAELRKMDVEIFKRTAENWNDFLSNEDLDFSPSGYWGFLNQARDYVYGNADKNIYFYAVVDPETGVSDCIFQVSHARPESFSPYLKVLAMRTGPEMDSRLLPYDAPWDSTEVRAWRSKVSGKITKGLLGLLRLTEKELPAAKIKVHHNKQANSEFFTFFQGTIESTLEWDVGLNFSGHNMWTEIVKNDWEPRNQ